MASRHYFTDAKNNRWFIQIDQATVKRLRDEMCIDLPTFDYTHLAALTDDPTLVEIRDFIQWLAGPRTSKAVLTFDLPTIARALIAFGWAMDERWPEKQLGLTIKVGIPALELSSDKLTNEASKA